MVEADHDEARARIGFAHSVIVSMTFACM